MDIHLAGRYNLRLPQRDNRSQVTGYLVNLFEGVTKDIKDERQPMGKRDTVV